MERRELSRQLQAQAFGLLGIRLTDLQLDQMMVYLEHLRAWNQSTNLTGITIDEDIVVKHFLDSMAGLSAESFPNQAQIVDVGSGAGFPGIPLKIVRPDLVLTLLEPSHKKASFLHFIVGVLKLSFITVVTRTLEQFVAEPTSQHRFNYVITRALKYQSVLRHAGELLATGGKALLYLSGPIEQTNIDTRWFLLKEYGFELPDNGGKRMISVLGVAG